MVHTKNLPITWRREGEQFSNFHWIAVFGRHALNSASSEPRYFCNSKFAEFENNKTTVEQQNKHLAKK